LDRFIHPSSTIRSTFPRTNKDFVLLLRSKSLTALYSTPYKDTPRCLPHTLPELGIPMLTDEYRRPIHTEIEEYMRRYVTNDQDWEKVDDEDCWGVNYTEPTTEVMEKIESILHTWGEEHPEEEQDDMRKLNPEGETFSVPHAARDPEILKDRNLENEDIFEIIRNPPEVGAVRIFEKPEFWDSTACLIKAVTT